MSAKRRQKHLDDRAPGVLWRPIRSMRSRLPTTDGHTLSSVLGSPSTLDHLVSTDELIALLRGQRDALARLGVLRLALFGSFARGEAGPDSDVDLLVELDERTFDRCMDLEIHLEDLLGRRIDLVLADRLKPRLREQVLSEVIEVFDAA